MNSVKKLSDENKSDVAKWVWKNEWWVMSDEWWVMSDEWWVMEIEWRKLSDEKYLIKQALIFLFFNGIYLPTKRVLRKKKCTGWQVWDPWIVWKNWVMKIKVMLPNECEKMSDEWWKLNDGNWVMKKPYPNRLSQK